MSRQASDREIRDGDLAWGAAQGLRRTLGCFLVAVAVLVPLKVTPAEGKHASVPGRGLWMIEAIQIVVATMAWTINDWAIHASAHRACRLCC